MTTDFRAVFGQFYGLPCSRYGLSCRKYGLPCNFWKSESHISPVFLGTSKCHINGLELNRVLRLYLEGTGRSLGAGRPFQSLFHARVNCFSVRFLQSNLNLEFFTTMLKIPKKNITSHKAMIVLLIIIKGGYNV